MEPRYVILLDFSSGAIIVIQLTDEELKQSEEYEDFNDFLSTLEEQYDFRVKDCIYMTTETLKQRTYIERKTKSSA